MDRNPNLSQGTRPPWVSPRSRLAKGRVSAWRRRGMKSLAFGGAPAQLSGTVQRNPRPSRAWTEHGEIYGLRVPSGHGDFQKIESPASRAGLVNCRSVRYLPNKTIIASWKLRREAVRRTTESTKPFLSLQYDLEAVVSVDVEGQHDRDLDGFVSAHGGSELPVRQRCQHFAGHHCRARLVNSEIA